MPVTMHGGLSGGVMVGLRSPKIFCLTSTAFSRQLGLWVHCRIIWVAVVCHRFIDVVLSDFSMAINSAGFSVSLSMGGSFLQGWLQLEYLKAGQ